MALPLAWSEASLATLARSLAERPLLITLTAASALASAMLRRSSPSSRAGLWLSDLPPALALVIVLDAVVAQPLGLRWLPADRLLDSFLLALILGAALALDCVHRCLPRLPAWSLAIASIALCSLLSSWNRPEPSLSLWPRSWPNEWPKYDVVARGARVTDLWEGLRHTPAGRVLFVRSAVPLEHRSDGSGSTFLFSSYLNARSRIPRPSRGSFTRARPPIAPSRVSSSSAMGSRSSAGRSPGSTPRASTSWPTGSGCPRSSPSTRTRDD